MNEQATIELLPWLLNDTLQGEERARVVAAVRSDPDHRAALAETIAAIDIFARHPESSTLVDLAYDRLPRGRRRDVQSHLALCDDCAEHTALVRASRALEGAEVVPLAPKRRRWPSLATAALAALLAVAVGLGLWRDLHTPTTRPMVGEAAVEVSEILFPESAIRRSGLEEPIRFAGRDRVTVGLQVENAAAGGEWQIDIVRMPAGEVVSRSVVEAWGGAPYLTVSLERALVSPGDYEARVSLAKGLRVREVDTYVFRVAPDD